MGNWWPVPYYTLVNSDTFEKRDGKHYLLTKFKGALMCIVCLETKSVMISRHYTTAHKEQYEKYTGDARVALISDLKGKLSHQQNLFAKFMMVQESLINYSLKASYAVSLVLAKL